MNYITQLNAFYSHLEFEPLSSNAIALWHGLMHICNKAAWAQEFKCANLTLLSRTGLSLASLQRARNELIQAELIIYKPGKNKNVVPRYSLPILYEQVNRQVDDIVNEQVDDWVNGRVNDKWTGSNPDTLNKQNKNKNKQNKETSSSDPKTDSVSLSREEFSELAKLYQEYGFPVNGTTVDWLKACVGRFGFSWVKSALQESEKRGKRNKSYVEAILTNWQTNGGMRLQSDKPKQQKKPNAFHNFEQQHSRKSEEELEGNFKFMMNDFTGELSEENERRFADILGNNNDMGG